MNHSLFIAKVDFYGKRKGIDYYLKAGAIHKSFEDKDDLIEYMEENGWFFLKSQLLRARSNGVERKTYYFRKSMAALQKEHQAEIEEEEVAPVAKGEY